MIEEGTASMRICGLDLSYTSPGVVVEEIDDKCNVTDLKFYGFTKTYKWSAENIVRYDPDEYKFIYSRYKMFFEYIFHWIKDCEYAFVEDYAYDETGMSGMVFNLAEFEGFIKQTLYQHNVKLRFYSPAQNKKFFSGYGKSDKIGMRDAFMSYKAEFGFDDKFKPNLENLPKVTDGKKGAAPTSDIIDAFSLCEFGRTELGMKAELMQIKDLTDKRREVFKKKSDECPRGLVPQEFIDIANDFHLPPKF